ncbi:MAG: hypothetical protein QOH88_2201 [Verrucomicrobiota bacterium]
MKSIVSFMAVAILALGPVTLAQAQTSPSHVPATSPASAAKAKPSPMNPQTSPPRVEASPTASLSPPPPPTISARTDVYHVHFTKAASGKAVQLADNLKKADPTDPMPGHMIVLRHQEGDSWDYAVIQHMGTKATVDAARPAPSPAVRDLSDWHNDTFVSGPSWADFTKAMGIDDAGKSKSAGSVYVVSVYRPAAGHRDQLEKMLGEAPGAGDTSSGNVLLQHLEGGAWTYLTVARYNSWADYATNESNTVAATNKNEGGWYQLREHTSFHNDTVCDRIAP